MIFGDTVAIDGGEISLDICIDGGEVGVFYDTGRAAPEYTGETIITPTRETQVLQTANTTVTEDITVLPIPHNYGLITYNGSILTVS